ncbi:MAG: hypothetical protein AB8G99_16905 [Planctomycetaceae bacterium]
MNEFEQYGIRFEYPEGWEVDSGQTEDGRTVTVNSPETSFWSVSLFDGRPSIESVLDAALSAYEEEYDEVDIYTPDADDAPVSICGSEETVARDVEFVCLELVNTVCLRAITADAFTLLVLYQGTDFELASTRSTLEKITQSLSLA